MRDVEMIGDLGPGTDDASEATSSPRILQGSTSSGTLTDKVGSWNKFSETQDGDLRTNYFCFTAIADTSIRASLTNPETCTVVRVGLGSGMMLLYTLFISPNSWISARYTFTATMSFNSKPALFTIFSMLRSVAS